MMDDIYEITPEEEEDIKFQEKCEAQKIEAPLKNGYGKPVPCFAIERCGNYEQLN